MSVEKPSSGNEVKASYREEPNGEVPLEGGNIAAVQAMMAQIAMEAVEGVRGLLQLKVDYIENCQLAVKVLSVASVFFIMLAVTFEDFGLLGLAAVVAFGGTQFCANEAKKEIAELRSIGRVRINFVLV